MKCITRETGSGMYLGTIVALVCACLTVPNPAVAQDQGYNAVYSPAGNPIPSASFFDASMFVGSGTNKSSNICGAIYGILSANFLTPPQTFTPGSVVDARGISGTTALTCQSGTSPWTNGATPVTVASTILLPAGTIVIPTSWILPPNTHLIGTGDGIPSSGFMPGTTIQASFTGSMIQFGTSTACLPPQGSPSLCSGFSVERLTLDGNNQFVNGIVNQYGTDPSNVDMSVSIAY